VSQGALPFFRLPRTYLYDLYNRVNLGVTLTLTPHHHPDTYTHTRAHTHIHTHAHTHTYTHAHTHTHSSRTHARTHAHTRVNHEVRATDLYIPTIAFDPQVGEGALPNDQ